jgi:hypothetical protein
MNSVARFSNLGFFVNNTPTLRYAAYRRFATPHCAESTHIREHLGEIATDS